MPRSSRRARPTDPDPNLPLKPVLFWILLVLSDGERHGYGIVKEIEERTGGAMRLEPGNLYRYVRRLLEVGAMAESTARPVPEADDERRRYYRVTKYGLGLLRAETRRMQSLVTEVQRRGLVGPKAP